MGAALVLAALAQPAGHCAPHPVAREGGHPVAHPHILLLQRREQLRRSVVLRRGGSGTWSTASGADEGGCDGAAAEGGVVAGWRGAHQVNQNGTARHGDRV
jgi:hypothetical protein